MKTVYFNYIEYVIGQAVDAIFEKDLYDAYKVRFNEIKESVFETKHKSFFSKIKRKFKDYFK